MIWRAFVRIQPSFSSDIAAAMEEKMSKSNLQLENLEKSFGGFKAVKSLSLTVPSGQMVGIIGRSGAGKSTMLRMINRLVEPTSGKILSGETDVTQLHGGALREWRASCAMIFQQFNLVNRLDVLTNVMLGGVASRSSLSNLCGIFSEQERRSAFDLLAELDMSKHALNRADGISGGQAQRAAIARALMQKPSIILADEPVASLDPRNAKVVMDALRDINKQRGLTVICNLHNLRMAKSYCDRVVAMVEGQIIFDCLPSELDAERVQAVYGSSRDDLDSSMADLETAS